MDGRGIGTASQSASRTRYQLAEGRRADTWQDESSVQELLSRLSEEAQPRSSCGRVLRIVGRRTETVSDGRGGKRQQHQQLRRTYCEFLRILFHLCRNGI